MRALHIILAALALVACAACSRRVVTEATSTATVTTAVRVDTVRVIQRTADTIRQRDSIIIDRAGDTIRIRQVQWRDRVSIIHDTITAYHTDTVVISKEATTTQTTTEQRSTWRKLIDWLAVIGTLALVAAVIWWRTK